MRLGAPTEIQDLNAERPSVTCYNFFNDLFFCSSHVHSFSLIGEGSRHTNFGGGTAEVPEFFPMDSASRMGAKYKHVEGERGWRKVGRP